MKKSLSFNLTLNKYTTRALYPLTSSSPVLHLKKSCLFFILNYKLKSISQFSNPKLKIPHLII